jgi:hypothetical protein
MKKSTRQLILLVGIMTILTGALVTINAARTGPAEDKGDSQAINTTPVGDNESKDTVKETSPNEDDTESTNSTNLLSQSVKGLQALWADFNRALEILPGISSNESDSNP